ncbi:voltage-gated sodium channel [Anaerobacillus arseniciselenatis]|uniref:Voltage-gated sodium channel n=1 Tax=Anaerobacillus arseniciselenatis TaxID=85682 RepID=A0A1S2LWD9_9BACI|nr:ion transporter [Anaerobacillus arseniciselenatis]OIJ15977.1 voltage-gated sodium channel [Anaerobacillus arseniciselenatis]
MTNRKKLAYIREKIFKLVQHKYFTGTVLGLIIFNAIVVGIETYPSIYESHKLLFFLIDKALIWIFTVEIVLRMIAERKLSDFFKSSWNWFDFLIVAAGHIFVGAHFVTVLRILRVLRVFRAISIIPSLRKLVDALLLTIPALGNIMLLMSIIFYIFAVIGTMLFQEVAPEYFGSLQLSLLTLFQVVTLESWASGVMWPIFHELPWSWIYFVSFVLVGTFVIFNLFIGVIVSNVEKVDAADNVDEKKDIEELKDEVKELKQLIINLSKEKS